MTHGLSCGQWVNQFGRRAAHDGVSEVNRHVFGYWGRQLQAREPVIASVSAPRGSGKSTSVRLLASWAAAERVCKYIMIVGESQRTASAHLRSIRHTFSGSKKLAESKVPLSHYPHMAPRQRAGAAASERDSASQYAYDGGIIQAVGFGAAVVGALEDDQRPDLIICDDIAGGKTAAKTRPELQVDYITQDLLPALDHDFGSFLFIGTPQMSGNVADQLACHARGELQPGEGRWIDEHMFDTHVVEPISDNGESFWPDRWTVDQLNAESLKSSWGYKFDSRPGAPDGWFANINFKVGALPARPHDAAILALDPCKTISGKSDAAVIVCYLWRHPQFPHDWSRATVGVMASAHSTDPGEGTRQAVMRCLTKAPCAVGVIEWNAQGDLARNPVEGLPCHWNQKHVSIPKDVRAMSLLSEFEDGPEIIFSEPMPHVTSQMRAYRGMTADAADYIDALGMAVSELRGATRPRRAAVIDGGWE